jgi:hypothetical protein
MLEDAHGARWLAQDLADAVGVEAGDHPKEDHVGLVARKYGKPVERGVKTETGCQAAVVLRPEHGEHLRRDRDGAPPVVSTARVDHTPAADREDEAQKRVPVALEARECPGGLDPDIRGEILGLGAGRCHSQVPQEAGMDVSPEHGESPLLTELGGGQDAAERRFGQIAHVPQATIGSRGANRESEGGQSSHQPWAISTSLGSSPAPKARYSMPSGPASTSRIVSLSIRIASHWSSSTISSSTLMRPEPLVTT